MVVEVSIPCCRCACCESGKTYYVYITEVSYISYGSIRKTHKIEKRYSSFHKLYKQVRKLSFSADLAEFPPKRLRNTSAKLLEARRIGLEIWLQTLLKRVDIIPPFILAFLQIEDYNSRVSIGDSDSKCKFIPSHLPIMSYTRDPYIEFANSSIQNSISKGVFMALYDPSFKLVMDNIKNSN